MAEKRLNIKVRAQGAKKAKKDLKGVESGISKLGKAAAIASSAFFAAKGLIAGLQESVKLAADFQLAVSKMEGVMRSMNRFTPQASKGLQDYADSLQEVTRFSNTAILEGITFLQTYKQIGDDVMPRAINMMADLAELMGGDMRTAANMVGKAAMGLSGELRRVGITVDEDIAKSGDFVAILTAIEEQVGGVAKAAGETLAGQFAQAGNAVDDLQRKFGETFIPTLTTSAKVLEEFAKQAQGIDWDLTFSSLKFQLMAVSPHFAALVHGLEAANKQLEILEDIRTDEPSPFPSADEQIKLMGIQAQTLELRREEGLILAEKVVPKQFEVTEAMKDAAEFASQTAISLGTSAIMGDNVTESLKRAVIQLGLMVAQAKLFDYFMDAAKGFTPGGFLSTAVSFLFGKSPTQAFPSPNAGSSNITINQNFGGMGVIDHNYASNSIIPAINKAISTGQARIG